MERLGELTFDDYDDDCQASAVELNNKVLNLCKDIKILIINVNLKS